MALLARFVLAEVRLLVGLGGGADVHAIWLTGNSKTPKAMVWKILLIAGAFQVGSNGRLIHLACG